MGLPKFLYDFIDKRIIIWDYTDERFVCYLSWNEICARWIGLDFGVGSLWEEKYEEFVKTVTKTLNHTKFSFGRGTKMRKIGESIIVSIKQLEKTVKGRDYKITD